VGEEKEIKEVKQKETEEHLVTERLTFKLTQEEYADKGKEAAEKAKELGEVEREFESIKKRFKGRIEEKQGELDDILKTIHRGEEERTVECVQVKDYKRHIVSYVFKGEVMKERPMEMHERQMELVTERKAVKRDPEAVRKEDESKMREHLGKMGVGDNGRKDIADVIRQETNAKTKVDLVQ